MNMETINKTPMQQLKDSYYKMGEIQFSFWVAQNMDRLLMEEKCLVIEGYEAGHAHRESNMFKLRTMLNELYGDDKQKQKEILTDLMNLDNE